MAGSEDKHCRVCDRIVKHMRANMSLYAMYTDGNYDAYINDHLCSDGRTSS